MQTPAEIVAVFVALLALFIGLLRYVVSFMQGYEKRRLELLEKYEKVLSENVKLRGQIAIFKFKEADSEKYTRYYYHEFQRYKILYETTLDKQKTKE